VFDLPTDAEPVRVIRGDCLDVLRALPDGCVDAVITDPPYGISYQSARRTGSERFPKIANDAQPFVWWLPEAARTLAPGGCLVCFCRWDTAEAFRLAIGWAGLRIGAQLVWDRMVHGLGDPSSRPAPQHDVMWFAVRGRYQLPDRRPTSVYRAQRIGGDQLEHPNQKPADLMRGLIRDYAPAGGVILDPFAGSGTTGVAAISEGRRAILIEKEPAYADIAERRIREAMGTGLLAGVV
jgi:site-specific DNA-methyltransferase (adenine-specific)